MIPKVKIKKWDIFECFSNTVYQYFFYGHYSINRALASGAYFRFPFLFEHLATAVLLPNNHGGKEHSKNLLSHFSPIGSKAFWWFLIPDFAPFNSRLLPKLTPFLVNKTRLYNFFLNQVAIFWRENSNKAIFMWFWMVVRQKRRNLLEHEYLMGDFISASIFFWGIRWCYAGEEDFWKNHSIP